ncbi:hypothetical protein BDK51DRAFT_39542 [Blyttiomyces helicus]|uniref:Uncharacterized protein n=1 Tax=Blyttiomyces helicus TaxID=388810 RepID=A0A4V1IQ11_9FUNG|nr:hypothetical protein BDK51DRAFT_39542 [Blyttiomyces helicus]|eukprot:RKO84937.1 hypothetical protein BDK51DRAFT_39542 [Blyttiomyces helicus]
MRSSVSAAASSSTPQFIAPSTLLSHFCLQNPSTSRTAATHNCSSNPRPGEEKQPGDEEKETEPVAMTPPASAAAAAAPKAAAALRKKEYDDRRKGQRHSVKLPPEHRALFREPYDRFLHLLLESFTREQNNPQSVQNALSHARRPGAPVGSTWVVWTSTPLRDQFRNSKARFPGITNAQNVVAEPARVLCSQFVEAMLFIHAANNPRRAVRPAAEAAPSDISASALQSPSSVSERDVSVKAEDEGRATQGHEVHPPPCQSIQPSPHDRKLTSPLPLSDYTMYGLEPPREHEPLPPYLSFKPAHDPTLLPSTSSMSPTFNEPLPAYYHTGDVDDFMDLETAAGAVPLTESSPILSYTEAETAPEEWTLETRPLTAEYREIFGDEPLPSYEWSVAAPGGGEMLGYEGIGGDVLDVFDADDALLDFAVTPQQPHDLPLSDAGSSSSSALFDVDPARAIADWWPHDLLPNDILPADADPRGKQPVYASWRWPGADEHGLQRLKADDEMELVHNPDPAGSPFLFPELPQMLLFDAAMRQGGEVAVRAGVGVGDGQGDGEDRAGWPFKPWESTADSHPHWVGGG